MGTTSRTLRTSREVTFQLVTKGVRVPVRPSRTEKPRAPSWDREFQVGICSAGTDNGMTAWAPAATWKGALVASCTAGVVASGAIQLSTAVVEVSRDRRMDSTTWVVSIAVSGGAVTVTSRLRSTLFANSEPPSTLTVNWG
jgi:hypothetical protein